MHIKALACEVIARQLFYCAARARHTMDIELMTQGLHDNADACRAELQQRIDAVDPAQFQALVLGYGLCNNALVGVRAGRVRTVVPRAHDCIALLLGSKERYAEEFAREPGTYYYSDGWLEYPERGGKRVAYDQKSGLARRVAYEELVRKYGAENAEFIQQVMSAWQVNYTRGAYIRFPFNHDQTYAATVQRNCAEKGWRYAEMPGDLALLQALLDGEWHEERFLLLEPGQKIKADYGRDILTVA